MTVMCAGACAEISGQTLTHQSDTFLGSIFFLAERPAEEQIRIRRPVGETVLVRDTGREPSVLRDRRRIAAKLMDQRGRSGCSCDREVIPQGLRQTHPFSTHRKGAFRISKQPQIDGCMAARAYARVVT